MAKKETAAKKVEKIAKPVLINARVTEKGAIMSESKNVYAFNVELDATKQTVARAIKAEYKVTPVKVRMVTIPAKRVMFRGRPGMKGKGKKAYVYLKKGDKISVA